MEEIMKECLMRLKDKKPLIHCITNTVTVNDVANILLACGASPIMAEDKEEVYDITTTTDGLTLNLGTLKTTVIPSMQIAAKRANELEHPVVLDPVGVGASRFRMQTAQDLLKEVKVSAIRCNMSEIRALSLLSNHNKGVDASGCDAVTEEDLSEKAAFVKETAKKRNCILTVTGEIDLVTDGSVCYCIRNGRPEMKKVTGTGCQLSALLAAFLASNPNDLLSAAATAVCFYGIAGEIAWEKQKEWDGNATYRNRIIDAVFHMDEHLLEERANYELR